MNKTRLFVVLCTLALGCLLTAQAEATKQSRTKQEGYVLQQVEAGKEADLLEQFVLPRMAQERRWLVREKGLVGYLDLLAAICPKEKEIFLKKHEEHLRIGARFLEDLLTGDIKVKVHRKGVRIKNAIIAEPIDLELARIPQSTILVRCWFKEPFVLLGAVFEGHLIIDGSYFEDEANFKGVRVQENLQCINAAFQGPVYFRSADIGIQFRAQGAQFLNKEQEANFNNLKVGVAAFFNNTTFQGPVNFVNAHIGGTFDAKGAKFLCQEHLANFAGMRVGQGAFFREITCNSNIDLRNGTYLDLFLTEAKPKGAVKKNQEGAKCLPKLFLQRTGVQRELRLENFKLATLEAQHLRVKGPATFQNLVIRDSANFQNADIEDLKFKSVTWPKDKKNLKLDGLTYTSLSVEEPKKPDEEPKESEEEPKESDKFQALLGLVQKSAFNPQNYLELEKYFKRAGHQDWADDVIITMKNRELAQMAWYDPSRWLVKIFWGWLAGYGRAPLRIFWLSLFIVLLGACLFNPDHLEKDKIPPHDKKLRRLLLRFLISLDQFLPAVKMGMAEHWKAKDNPFPIWLYFTVEQVLGWIIIPIALAAIYTQIK